MLEDKLVDELEFRSLPFLMKSVHAINQEEGLLSGDSRSQYY